MQFNVIPNEISELCMKQQYSFKLLVKFTFNLNLNFSSSHIIWPCPITQTCPKCYQPTRVNNLELVSGLVVRKIFLQETACAPQVMCTYKTPKPIQNASSLLVAKMYSNSLVIWMHKQRTNRCKLLHAN